MISLPQRVELPFFAYGAFKPGELAFTQIENYLKQQPEPGSVSGSLMVRDGLPLFNNKGGGNVEGFLFEFEKKKSLSAYETISKFEPKDIYFWKKMQLSTPKVSANILVGKLLNRGRPHDLEENIWSFRMDPVFEHGLSVVEEIARQFGGSPFESAPPDFFDWPRFFKLQMAYLLLWSAIERFSSFAYGPSLNPEQKVKALNNDPHFWLA